MNASFGTAAAGGTVTVDEAATAQYGVLHARSSNVVDLARPGELRVLAAATFEDVITINYAPLTGQAGSLFVDYTLAGQVSSSLPVDNAFAEVLVFVDHVFYSALHSSSTSGVFGTRGFPFIYGKPFGLHVDLVTMTGTVTPSPDGSGYRFSPEAGSGTASADFGNTLVLSGLLLSDASGDPVTGSTYSSASGTEYSAAGVVPEPSTMSMMAGGLAVLGFAARRRKRT